MEIIAHVHLIPNVVANPYLIVESNGLALIDAGLPGSDKKILQYINGLGYASSDLKWIVITHSDIDHFGGLSVLKKKSGASVYASPIEAEAMSKGSSSRQIIPRNFFPKLLMGVAGRLMKPVPIHADEILSEGQVLPFWVDCTSSKHPVIRLATYPFSRRPLEFYSRAIPLSPQWGFGAFDPSKHLGRNQSGSVGPQTIRVRCRYCLSRAWTSCHGCSRVNFLRSNRILFLQRNC